MNCFLHHRHGIKDIIIVYVVNHKSYLLCANVHFFLPQTDGVPGIGTALSIKLLLKKHSTWKETLTSESEIFRDHVGGELKNMPPEH